VVVSVDEKIAAAIEYVGGMDWTRGHIMCTLPYYCVTDCNPNVVLRGALYAARAELTQLRADLAALVPVARYARDCRSDFEVEWRAEYGDEPPELLPSLAAGFAVLARYAEVPRG
jgi:hypothetical protein